MEYLRPVVIDLGSGWIKAGFAGDAAPQVVFPTVVGRPKYQGIMIGKGQKDHYVGDEALDKSGILKLEYPIKHGVIGNWDDLDKIISHVLFNELCVSPEEQPLLITIAPFTPRADLEKLTQMLFEGFGVPAAAITTPSVLALIATGRATGIVLDSGYGVTQVAPIVDGKVRHSVDRLLLAGNDLSDYLVTILGERGYALNTTAERVSVNAIKEKHCYVAFDFAIDMAIAATTRTLDKTCQLPDGDLIMLVAERFRCPEVLFQPSLLGWEDDGIHKLLYQAIMKYPAELREMLFANIVLAGGTTLLPGLAARLEKELTALAPAGTKVNIIAPPARNQLAWLGGANLAASASWQDWWLSAQEYNKSGPSIVHDRFF